MVKHDQLTSGSSGLVMLEDVLKNRTHEPWKLNEEFSALAEAVNTMSIITQTKTAKYLCFFIGASFIGILS